MRNTQLPEMINYFRKENGWTMRELGEKLDKSESAISKWIKGVRSPMVDDFEKMVALFNTDTDTLMYGASVNQSSTKSILDRVFAKLDAERQEKVVIYAESELRNQRSDNTIQLFPYQVQEKLSAGTGYSYEEGAAHEITFYDEEIDYDCASWINGDSMLPDYNDRDVALIKECPFDYDGEVYAIDWDGQSYIKKVYKEADGLRLVSLNEKYGDKFAPYSEEPRVIGKVVGSFTPIKKTV